MAGNGASTMLELALSFERADPNIPDNEGNTPLHFAAQAGKRSPYYEFKERGCRGKYLDLFFPSIDRSFQGARKYQFLLRGNLSRTETFALHQPLVLRSKESGHVVDINFTNTSRVVRKSILGVSYSTLYIYIYI